MNTLNKPINYIKNKNILTAVLVVAAEITTTDNH